jgi:hypothetical protein
MDSRKPTKALRSPARGISALFQQDSSTSRSLPGFSTLLESLSSSRGSTRGASWYFSEGEQKKADVSRSWVHYILEIITENSLLVNLKKDACEGRTDGWN